MANYQSPVTGQLQIEAFGTDLNGRQFIEQTRTLTITRDGATIALANKLAPDSELIVRNRVTNEEAVARVVDLLRDEVFVQVYGIAFIDPTVDIWHAEFSEAESKKRAVMECNRCHTVDAFLVSGIENEVLESKQTLRRFCKCSNSATIWNLTDRRVTERRTAERVACDQRRKISAIKEPTAPARQERRKGKRTAMKAPACIRRNGSEEVAVCEDLSRGGFSFKSQKARQAGKSVEAAVPYAKNSVNIFVPARISYRQQLSGGFYRHGVEYGKFIE